ncbi:hypothetical protein [Nocardioides renjunii]|uniref:hypothetical protein n=1 Tax=Nocardioides renjunii TaxID=3095075 RepID=UPI002AFE4F2F|nr:hypothetical protein [Nocardioides sp. S-34]WQQ24214.1 hypothetical protein SHK17_09555 [Nocardioides sp. S-34]
MSAPPTDVVDRLERLADHAPGGTVDPDAVWARGRRRQGRRTASVLAAIVAAGVLAAAVTPAVLARVEPPVAASSQRMVLPDVLEAPGAWTPAFTVTPRRLSAVGVGQRAGLWSSSAALWGVDAGTGEGRWLELPGALPTAEADAQLSADGRRLAYWVTGTTPGEPMSMGGTEDDTPVVGLAVVDLETGGVVRWDVESEHGLAVQGLVWAGDVVWWQGGPVTPLGSGRTSTDIETHVWDVETDERSVIGGKDPRAALYLNEAGNAPQGFVTLPRTFRLQRVTEAEDPVSLRMDLPPDAPSTAGLFDPQMATDGRRVAALMVREAAVFDDAEAKELLVGSATEGTVVLKPVEGVGAQSLLGWRSPSEVVASIPTVVDESQVIRGRQVSAVDVTTGARTELLELRGALPVSVAAEAWTAEVVEAPDAPFAPDPRLVGVGGMVVIVFLVSLVRDLRRRRGHP